MSIPLGGDGLYSDSEEFPGLRSLDVIDHAKLDSDEKLARVSETLSLRGRPLEGAVLYSANLTKVDFTGAQLQGANLKDARLQGALLEQAKLNGAILNFSKLQGASLQKASLNNAQMKEANLQGANLFEADLSNADLELALLFAAELSKTKLHGTNFDFAKLGGANLSGVKGDVVRFRFAELQGVSLTSAKLTCALFDGTQLQGAAMEQTILDNVIFGASEPTVIWKVDVRSTTEADIRDAAGQVCGTTAAAPRKCALRTSLNNSYENLLETIKRDVPKGILQTTAMKRIETLKLNPQIEAEEAEESEIEKAWAHLERESMKDITSVKCPP